MKLVPLKGSPPIPTQRVWPEVEIVSWFSYRNLWVSDNQSIIRLTESDLGGLVDGLVGEGARAGDDSDLSLNTTRLFILYFESTL